MNAFNKRAMNNNKILFLIIAVAGLAAGITSCKKTGTLDPQITALDEQATFSDSAKTMQFLFGIYSDISFAFGYKRYTYASNISASTAEGCDEGVHRLNGPTQPFVYLFNGTLNAVDNAPYVYMWNTPYTDIRRVNVFLSQVEKAPISAALKQQSKAEARFLRAWYYATLLKNFGGIPIIGDTVYTASDPIKPARSSYEDCVNYILSECDAAAAVLPVAYSATDYGRITKGACLGLKSRILLYAASPLFNGGSVASDPNVIKLTAYPTADPSRWQKAAQAALDVINTSLYSLYEDNTTAPGYGFSRVFLTRVNSEYILPGMLAPNKTMETFATPTSRGANPTQTAPSQNLAEAFGMNNGKAITDPTSGFDPQNPFVNRDPRFNWTFVYNGTNWYSTTTGTKIPVNIYFTKASDGTLTPATDATLVWLAGYYWRKMMDDGTASNGGPNTDRCLPLIRYAEILLNYAEASNETGNTSVAYDQLKLIRKRAGINPGTDGLYGLKAGMTKDEMRAVLQNEREVELAYEDHRYWDVRRWKIAQATQNVDMKAMQVVKVGSTYQYNIIPVNVNAHHQFKDAYYLFPIMQSE
ncbi:MAG: RagB/SusD family nutrient uptake outer membrane protein, partial [Bacteroidetes bacterium]|nr:RagB/SusD family nutrient uptake outer membrane protein [Bacteroidota bacterium]